MADWLMMNIYTLLIGVLLCIFSHRQGTKNMEQAGIFNNMVALLIILLLADSIGRLEDCSDTGIILQKIGSFLVFALDPFIAFLIIKYVDVWTKPVKRGQKIIINIIMAISIANVLIILLSNIFSWKAIYYFENGVYYRGPLFVVRVSIVLGMSFLVGLYVVLYKKYIDRRYVGTIAIFPFIPLFFGLIQVLVYGYAFEYAGMMIACLILFVHIQSKTIGEDYLTQTASRYFFDKTFATKMQKFRLYKKKFSAFVIDLDHFKQINDQYGHTIGDEALIEASRILRESFNKNDTICRMGGDEFCVISNIHSQKEIDQVVQKIQKKIKNFNKKNETYQLGFSIGHSIYDENIGAEKFMADIDELMYEEKEMHHSLEKV